MERKFLVKRCDDVVYTNLNGEEVNIESVAEISEWPTSDGYELVDGKLKALNNRFEYRVRTVGIKKISYMTYTNVEECKKRYEELLEDGYEETTREEHRDFLLWNDRNNRDNVPGLNPYWDKEHK